MSQSSQTRRVINLGAEQWLNQSLPCLDHGYIKLVDYMGADVSIVAAARVSYAKEVDPQDKPGNERLIRFLMNHRHTSPFEHCILTFECKMPIFVAREWVRHRTARLNEVSGRYTQLPNEIYMPPLQRIQAQDAKNKQGSAGLGTLPLQTQLAFLDESKRVTGETYEAYESALTEGVAREIARKDLPLSLYTKWVWQMDLHNLLHFLKLRLAPAAQWEIRIYAEAIARIVKDAFPIAWAAFEEFDLYAVVLSKTEKEVLLRLLNKKSTKDDGKILTSLLDKLHS